MILDVIFQQESAFECVLNEGEIFDVSFGGESYRPEQYTGPVEVTPSTEEQVLNVAEKLVTKNITIKPIPNNYGLITWNGATLTVS